jgi:hypothetical protein
MQSELKILKAASCPLNLDFKKVIYQQSTNQAVQGTKAFIVQRNPNVFTGISSSASTNIGFDLTVHKSSCARNKSHHPAKKSQRFYRHQL